MIPEENVPDRSEMILPLPDDFALAVADPDGTRAFWEGCHVSATEADRLMMHIAIMCLGDFQSWEEVEYNMNSVLEEHGDISSIRAMMWEYFAFACCTSTSAPVSNGTFMGRKI